MAARAALDRAAELWHALSDSEFEAWTEFAAREGVATYRLFSGLNARLLKMDPRAAHYAAGKAVLRGRSDIVNWGFRIVERGGRVGDPQSTMLSLVASQANAEGVVTKILAQAIATRWRKPQARDGKSRGFVNARTGQATARATLGAAAVA